MSGHVPAATQKGFCFKEPRPLLFTCPRFAPYLALHPSLSEVQLHEPDSCQLITDTSRGTFTWLLGNCHQFLYHNSCSFSIFFANFASSLLCLRSHSSNVLFPLSIHTFGVFMLSLALKIIFVLMTHKLYPLPP